MGIAAVPAPDHADVVVVVVLLGQVINERLIRANLLRQHRPVKSAMGVAVEVRPRGIQVDAVGQRHPAQDLKVGRFVRDVDDRPVEGLRQCQTVRPVDVLPAALDCQISVGRSAVVSRLGPWPDRTGSTPVR